MFKIIGADGKEYGPISLEQLRQWMKEGRVNLQTKVLPEGATDWIVIGQVPELAASLPPPTPRSTNAPGMGRPRSLTILFNPFSSRSVAVCR